MRAFVALALPEEVRDALEEVQAGLRYGRHVPSENMHVTLAFLDDQPETRLEALHEALSEIAMPAPELRITGLDAFGGRRPRLIFAALDKTKPLVDLRAAVHTCVRRAGIDLPRERFRPHITLARLPHQQPDGLASGVAAFLNTASGFSAPPFFPCHLGLYASQLTPEGPLYSDLASYPFTCIPGG